ncbi:MAG: LytR C-terminal domain-containing protein [bacterium]|nr:LytR C-terminal domain-containing protein [bacterium]
MVKDYRLPRKGKAAPARSQTPRRFVAKKRGVPLRPTKPTRTIKPRSSISRSSSKNKKPPSSWVSTAIVVVVGIVVLILSGLLAFNWLLPQLIPLERALVVSLLSHSGTPQTGKVATVAVFKPDDQLITLYMVSPADDQAIATASADLTQTHAAQSLLLQRTFDGSIVTPEGTVPLRRAGMVELLRAAMSEQSLTNLSRAELFKLWLFARSIPNGKFVVENKTYGAWQAVSKSVLPADELQKCSIAVTNGTPKAGLANTVSAIFENSGYPVVRVVASEKVVETTRVVVSDASATNPCFDEAETIARVLPTGVAVTADTATTEKHRSAIVVEVGSDVQSWFSGL